MMKDVHGFRGVFAHNQVDDLKPKKGDSIIMNLDTIQQGGSHWVAFFFSPENAVYFDSFGVPPDNRSLNYLEKYGKQVLFSDEQIQEDSSIECGYYSMAFIRAMNSGMTLQEFLLEFTKVPSSYNENLVVKESRP